MKKVVGVLIFAMLVVAVPVVGEAQSNASLDAQISALQQQIDNLIKQIAELRAQRDSVGQTDNTGPIPEDTPVVVIEPKPSAQHPICSTPIPIMRIGSRGGSVTLLQSFLKSRPEAAYPATLPATGFFGPTTQNSVRNLQRAHNIVSSGDAFSTGYGAVGPKTSALIRTLACSDTVVIQPIPEASLNITTPDLGAAVSFPIKVKGTTNIGWNTFEGSAGTVRLFDERGNAQSNLAILEVDQTNQSESFFVANLDRKVTKDLVLGQRLGYDYLLFTEAGAKDGEILSTYIHRVVISDDRAALGVPFGIRMNQRKEILGTSGDMVAFEAIAIADCPVGIHCDGRPAVYLSFDGKGKARETATLRVGDKKQLSSAYGYTVHLQGYDDGLATVLLLEHNVSVNKPPVVETIKGPVTLNVNQTGTWTVVANDPENKSLSYHVDWGENVAQGSPNVATSQTDVFSQTATFTHSYSSPGTYTVSVTVKDPLGATAKSSISVRVGAIVTGPPKISSVEPSSAKTWDSVLVHGSNFVARSGNTLTSSPIEILFDGQVLTEGSISSNGGSVKFTLPEKFKPVPINCFRAPCAGPVVRIVTPGIYKLQLRNSNGTSNAVSFTVIGSDPGPVAPNISRLSPSSGVAGDNVTVSIENYYANTDYVAYFNGVRVPLSGGGGGVTGPSDSRTILPLKGSVTFAVPQGFNPGTHPVWLTNKAGKSNELKFTLIGDTGTKRGDCNADGSLDRADVTAIQNEIFDGDGSLASNAGSGSHKGDPIGCDANADSFIDAGDLTCLNIILGGNSCTPGANPSIDVKIPALGTIWSIGDSVDVNWDISNGQSLPNSNLAVVISLVGGNTNGVINHTNNRTAGEVRTGHEQFVLKGSVFKGDMGLILQPGKYRLNVKIYEGTPCLGLCVAPSTARLITEDTTDYFTITGEIATKVTIVDVVPDSGSVGNKVEIKGSGFSATGNNVYFNGQVAAYNIPAAKVLDFSGRYDQMLRFTVPQTLLPDCAFATSGPVCKVAAVPTPAGKYSVTVKNAQGTLSNSDHTFMVEKPSSVTVESIDPRQGKVRSFVSIEGFGFTDANNDVFFGDRIAANNIRSASIAGSRRLMSFNIPSMLMPECAFATSGPVCDVAFTPTPPGKYLVRVRNGNGEFSSNSLSYTVLSDTSSDLSLFSPNRGEVYREGSSIVFSWKPRTPGINGIELIPVDGGKTHVIYASRTANTQGWHVYKVPSDGILPGGEYWVRVYSSIGNEFSEVKSIKPITIIGRTQQAPSISFLSPQQTRIGETLTVVGKGFSGVGQVMLNGNAVHYYQTNSDSKIVFQIPKLMQPPMPPCPEGFACPAVVPALVEVTPGKYMLTVKANNRTSNEMIFTVSEN